MFMDMDFFLGGGVVFGLVCSSRKNEIEFELANVKHRISTGYREICPRVVKQTEPARFTSAKRQKTDKFSQQPF